VCKAAAERRPSSAVAQSVPQKAFITKNPAQPGAIGTPCSDSRPNRNRPRPSKPASISNALGPPVGTLRASLQTLIVPITLSAFFRARLTSPMAE